MWRDEGQRVVDASAHEDRDVGIHGRGAAQPPTHTDAPAIRLTSRGQPAGEAGEDAKGWSRVKSARLPPAAIVVNVLPPLTADGVLKGDVRPFPSAPNSPIPQQYPDPVVVTAHVWVSPVPIVSKLRPPATATGTALKVLEP